MEVSFKFNNGEFGQEMVSAILALFGAQQATAQVVNVTAPATLNPADNPEAGSDDAGPTNNGTHDAAGVPWDARIHSEKRTTTDAGLWRKRKGCPPNMVNSVMAELAAQGKILGTPAAAPVAPQAPAPVVTVPAGQGATATIITPPAQMPLAPVAMPTPPAMTPPPAIETPYQKLVNFIAANMQSPANPAGRLTPEYVANALKTWGHVGADGNGAIQSLEAAPAERVQLVHQSFAQALGVAA